MSSKGEMLSSFAKFQAELRAAQMDATNPHFQSKYATLASVFDVIRAPLASNGFGVTQRVYSSESKYFIHTMLIHQSGESIDSGEMELRLVKPGMQELGSAITYAKRYQLSALLGVVSDEDDDANRASDVKTKPTQEKLPVTTPERFKVKTISTLPNLVKIAKKKSVSSEDMTALIKKLYNKGTAKELTHEEVSELCDLMEKNEVKTLIQLGREPDGF